MKVMERSDMQKTMLHIKGNRLPFDILKKMSASVHDSFTITKNDIGEDLPYPPEEDFRPEFVAEVEKSSREYHAGRRDDIVSCKTQEEVEELFENIMMQND